VRGVFSLGAKGYSFSGDGHTCYWYSQIYGDYLFHSILYHEGTFDVLDGRLGMNLSLGCVRLHIDNAKWIYDEVPYGTTVVTYGDYR
jgi:lipoprotein-anchoring transpeptidase ErfK/SrfK